MGDSDDLKTTPLDGVNRRFGAKMVAFAGYAMPVNYEAGVLREHLHTRESAGLFDVSHMGQIRVTAKSGALDDAAHALESLVPVSVAGLKPGRQRYALFTSDEGGILDDFMIANRGDHFFLVVNAACKADDFARLRSRLADTCDVEMLDDRALVALQGPKAESVLSDAGPAAAAMRFMDVAEITVAGTPCIVSRSGYTGEDGFEISIPASEAEAVVSALLSHEAVEPAGLGARDSLRLEAGLCLYGNDMDADTTPAEASLEWAIQKVRRRGGTREGGFPGADHVLAQIEAGPARRRVGIKPEGRAPVRAGAPLYADDAADAVGMPIGTVTSGCFSPSLSAPIAMGHVPADMSEPGTALYAEVRGKRLPITVAALPFVEPHYKR